MTCTRTLQPNHSFVYTYICAVKGKKNHTSEKICQPSILVSQHTTSGIAGGGAAVRVEPTQAQRKVTREPPPPHSRYATDEIQAEGGPYSIFVSGQYINGVCLRCHISDISDLGIFLKLCIPSDTISNKIII